MPTITENKLREAFGRYGKVTKVYLLDPKNCAQGERLYAAFVSMSSSEEARKALVALHDTMIDDSPNGKRIIVRMSNAPRRLLVEGSGGASYAKFERLAKKADAKDGPAATLKELAGDASERTSVPLAKDDSTARPRTGSSFAVIADSQEALTRGVAEARVEENASVVGEAEAMCAQQQQHTAVEDAAATGGGVRHSMEASTCAIASMQQVSDPINYRQEKLVQRGWEQSAMLASGTQNVSPSIADIRANAPPFYPASLTQQAMATGSPPAASISVNTTLAIGCPPGLAMVGGRWVPASMTALSVAGVPDNEAARPTPKLICEFPFDCEVNALPSLVEQLVEPEKQWEPYDMTQDGIEPPRIGPTRAFSKIPWETPGLKSNAALAEVEAYESHFAALAGGPLQTSGANRASTRNRSDTSLQQQLDEAFVKGWNSCLQAIQSLNSQRSPAQLHTLSQMRTALQEMHESIEPRDDSAPPASAMCMSQSTVPIVRPAARTLASMMQDLSQSSSVDHALDLRARPPGLAPSSTSSSSSRTAAPDVVNARGTSPPPMVVAGPPEPRRDAAVIAQAAAKAAVEAAEVAAKAANAAAQAQRELEAQKAAQIAAWQLHFHHPNQQPPPAAESEPSAVVVDTDGEEAKTEAADEAETWADAEVSAPTWR